MTRDQDGADEFRRCGRLDDHTPHAWTAWMRSERGNVIRVREWCRYYWCDGKPPE